MCSIRVARELEQLRGGQLEDLLGAAADSQQDLAALLRRASLSASNVGVTASGDALADGAGPDADSVEGLAYVDDDAHDLAVLLLLEGLADGCQHHVQPQLVDVDVALFLEGVRPFAAVLVLEILPLGAYTGLEEVVVGFEGQIGDGRDVVLGAQS